MPIVIVRAMHIIAINKFINWWFCWLTFLFDCFEKVLESYNAWISQHYCISHHIFASIAASTVYLISAKVCVSRCHGIYLLSCSRLKAPSWSSHENFTCFSLAQNDCNPADNCFKYIFQCKNICILTKLKMVANISHCDLDASCCIMLHRLMFIMQKSFHLFENFSYRNKTNLTSSDFGCEASMRESCIENDIQIPPMVIFHFNFAWMTWIIHIIVFLKLYFSIFLD